MLIMVTTHLPQRRRWAGDNDARPLVIPATAPLLTGTRAVVYVQLPDEEQPTFEPRDVLLGPRTGAWYIVREGLDEGDLVVVNGAFKIDAELQIRGRPSMMQPEGGAPPSHDHGGMPHPFPASSPPLRRHRRSRCSWAELATGSFELVQALASDDPEAARQAAKRGRRGSARPGSSAPDHQRPPTAMESFIPDPPRDLCSHWPPAVT
jgi:hypothetical protein